MKAVHAPRVRAKLAEIIGRLPSEGMTTAKIIESLKKEYPEDVMADRDDLMEVALFRIVSQIGSRHSNATPNLEPDLFGNYSVQPTIYVTIQNADGPQRVMKSIGDVTLDEAERYIAEHRRPVAAIAKDVKEFVRMIGDFKASGASPKDKVGDWWALAKKSAA
ncbi:MAG TPA: hypothetical protein VGH40_05330 [Roseiarcus sp.]|jgi:hypothetical protein